MAYELVYTSAPAGLVRGSSGFCVVACTRGLGPRLVVTLEGLSAYKPLYPHYAPNAQDNPVSRSHYLYEANGETQHILSRICFNGVDHTQRSNKLASHLVLSKRETILANGGPPSVLLHGELFKDADWEIIAQYFPTQKTIPATLPHQGRCVTWESIMGDAGWAGYLAQLYMENPGRNVYIAYLPEQNPLILPLLHEAVSLLPEEMRWKVTFSTYFVNLPAGMSCSWRCCPVDSDALRAARRSPLNVIIDISAPQNLDKNGVLITLARTGKESIVSPQNTIQVSGSPVQKAHVEEEEVVRLAVPEGEKGNNFVSEESAIRLDVNRYSGKNTTWQMEAGRQEKSRSGLIAVAAVCIMLIMAAAAYGVFYSVDHIKNRQIYTQKNAECVTLSETLSDVEKRRVAIAVKRDDVRTEEKVDELISEIKDLMIVLETVREGAGKLKKFQPLFVKYQKKSFPGEKNRTPEGLENFCKKVNSLLEQELRLLEKKKEKMIGRKKKLEAKNNVSGRKQNGTPEKKEKKAEKAEKVPAKELNAVPVKKVLNTERKKEPLQTNIHLPEDDIRYLWKHSAKFHRKNNNKNETIEIRIGNAKPEDVKIAILPEVKLFRKAGSVIRIENEHGQEVFLKTRYVPGKVVFRFQNERSLPEDKDVLICIGKKKELPLFFRLETSKICLARAKDAKNLNIKFEDEKRNVRILIPENVLLIPEKCYNKHNIPLRTKAVLKMRTGENRKVTEFQRHKGGSFVAEIAYDEALKENREKLNELMRIKVQIEKNIAKYIRYVPEDKRGKEQYKKFMRLKKIVESPVICRKISNKLKYQPDKPEINAWKLRKMITGKMKEVPDIKTWIENYDALMECKDELVKIILDGVPLETLFPGSYSGTFEKEKSDVEIQYEKLQQKMKDEIYSGMLLLDKYEQFTIRELIQ